MARRAHLAAGFRRVLLAELRQIGARPGLMFMLAPFPLLLFALLAVVFHLGLPRDLPIAVVDLDRSTLSRQMVRMVDAAPDVAVAREAGTLAEGRQLLLSGKAYAVVLIPVRTERDVLAGRRPEVVLFYNNQYMTPGSLVARSVGGVLGTVAAGISVEARVARGADVESATQAVTPVPVRQSALFNPSLEYVQFLLAAVMPTVLQIFIGASAALSFARDRQGVAGLGRSLRLGGTLFRTTAGKLAPYTLAYLLVLWGADALLFGPMGARFGGSLAFHAAYGLVFVLASQMLGAAAALVARDTVSALAAVGVIASPAFGFTGITFPRLSMNGFSRFWADLLPVTHYLELRTDNILRGAPLETSLPAFGCLLGLALIYGGVALLLLWRHGRPRPVSAVEAGR
ncbi:ABC transporter permease [Pleomorphomonas carboxyditropha]|uniref:ABC transporter permease n=1 Tax=Pleomorphomonas carboxyditropha TaxID=2023338 RepID=A0A2G9WVE8_9HYPH|nr:ABC transporter permease [Pleomorphomonas carboxyditropha]PIO98688.1 ABC transporter permease [Pleomorphomonas carboxyditropha]